MAITTDPQPFGRSSGNLPHPDPHVNAPQILAWAICWPWNLLWTVFAYNPLRYFVEFAVTEFRTALQEISSGQFRDIQNELLEADFADLPHPPAQPATQEGSRPPLIIADPHPEEVPVEPAYHQMRSRQTPLRRPDASDPAPCPDGPQPAGPVSASQQHQFLATADHRTAGTHSTTQETAAFRMPPGHFAQNSTPPVGQNSFQQSDHITAAATSQQAVPPAGAAGLPPTGENTPQDAWSWQPPPARNPRTPQGTTWYANGQRVSEPAVSATPLNQSEDSPPRICRTTAKAPHIGPSPWDAPPSDNSTPPVPPLN